MTVKIVVLIATYMTVLTASGQTEHYEWSSLPFGGAGFVTGLITCPEQQGLMYARTDVGGAYRWDAAAEQWIPITDFLSANEVGLMGVESIAIDPSMPNRVYMYCGTSYWNNGLSAILRSDDYGQTFSRMATVTTQFPAHGNDGGRQCGERLAVCPIGNQLLLCGSRNKGLWKSENSGRTWRRMASTTFTGSSKMSFVQFVDSATVFAAQLTKGSANLFRSTDGGTTWTAVDGAPTDYMPHRCRLTPDKTTLYIAYTDSEGPGTNGSGALMKLDLTTGEWTDISPAAVSMGDVSVAYDNPNRLMAVSLGLWKGQYWSSTNTTWGDQIWISRNGGKTWTNLMESGHSTYSEAHIRWLTGSCQLHWCGSAQMNPFNSSQAFFISGNGILQTSNLWATTPRFKMCVNGLEETVPLNIVSVTGAPLAVTIGDYDGCLYTDVTRYYKRFSPSMGSTSAIAIAALNVKLMLRGATDLYFTRNGGTTWSKKDKPISDRRISACALSADGTMLVVTPQSSKPYYSTDEGTTWHIIDAAPSGISLYADPVHSNIFYGHSGSTFYVLTYTSQTDTFTATTCAVSGVTGRMCVVDGREGDVWLPRGANGLTHLTQCHTGQPVVGTVRMSSATCVGAGKARQAYGYPALYIYGRQTASQTIGLYRSDDAGSSWLRINDDQHQFGGPGNAQIVSGDMNEYGRVYMSTVGRGVVTGKYVAPDDTHIQSPAFDTSSASANIKPDNIYDLTGIRTTSVRSSQPFVANGKKVIIL